MRLVVKGFGQKPGIDFTDIFSPVVKHSSIHIILVVARLNLELEQLDIKTAFLHGDLEEEIYMRLLDGCSTKDKNLVCRLKRSLYGLKQGPRQWYRKLDNFMQRQRYKKCDEDHCVYLQRNSLGKITILLLYVDDMLVAGNDVNEIQR